MQCSLVPRIARPRFTPVIAAQPEPGSRLLQGMAVSRKYTHRVRWSRLPAVVAMLRSCADAPARIACDSTAYSRWTVGWFARSELRTRAPIFSPPSGVASILPSGKRRLHGMQCVWCAEAFDGRDLFAVVHQGQAQA